MARKLSKDQWEQRIRDAGDGRYEFVRWDGEFKNCSSRAFVRCLVDNYEWSATALNIVYHGSGCHQCAGLRRFSSTEYEERINKLEYLYFIKWHGEYNGVRSKAVVRCRIDGFEWASRVNDLINKNKGCPQCANLRRWSSAENEQRINKSGDGKFKFVSWVGNHKNIYSKAIIRCLVDGFEWTAKVNDIVNCGSGCPKCSKHGFQLDKTGYLYALRSECGQYIKVGISNNPNRRHKELERRTPFKFNLVERISGDGAKISDLEKYFHGKHERAGFTGFDGATEWLICTPQLLEELRELGDAK